MPTFAVREIFVGEVLLRSSKMLWTKFTISQLIYGVLIFWVSLDRTFANRNRKRAVSDPVSNFFSELGELFLDVDQTLAVQTAPKVQHEESVVSQVFRPTNEYFNRIQKNYQNIQSRLGRLIGNALGPKTTYSDRELSTVSPPTADANDETYSTSAPVIARRLDDASSTKEDQEHSTAQEVSSLDIRENECSGGPLSDPFLEHLRKERCSRKNRIATEEQLRKAMDNFLMETKRASDLLIPLGSRTIDQLSNDFVRRVGDIESDGSEPQGRIIGDLMFSESLYDQSFRQFLRNHGRWILDNPLLSRWRQSPETTVRDDTTSETMEYSTESVIPATESITEAIAETESTEIYDPEYREILSKSERSLDDSLPPQASKYYRVMNKDGEIIEEEVDIVLEPESQYDEESEPEDIAETDIEADEIEEIEPQDSVILAFTPDGIPLKLRMGPEVDNPIGYLHRVLKSAGVNLNIPVESYEDLEPVGKEVLKLGSGILTRAIYIDVSNNNELKALLKTLMRSKESGKSKF